MIIAIEGIDGAGKTTLAKSLAFRLRAPYQKFPDRTTATGRILDQLLRHGGHMPPLAFQALQVCNRVEHLPQLVRVYGDDFHHLICDRYQDSGLVYGLADGLERSEIEDLSRAVPPADIHVLLRVDPFTVDRTRLAGRDREMYETGGVPRLAGLEQRFADLWREHEGDNRWFVVDGNQPPAEVLAETLDLLKGVAIHE